MNGPFSWLKSEEKPEPTIDEIPHECMSSMSCSLTAYFNVHSLNKNKPLYPGLVIPFDARFSDDGLKTYSMGYMISTGEISEGGNHIVRAVSVGCEGGSKEKKVAVPFELEM